MPQCVDVFIVIDEYGLQLLYEINTCDCYSERDLVSPSRQELYSES